MSISIHCDYIPGQEDRSMKTKRLLASVKIRISILLLINLVLAGIILSPQGPSLLDRLTASDFMATDDFVEYWAAGRLTWANENPYDLIKLKSIQERAGRFDGVPVVMWNPPWTMPICAPFNMLPYPQARLAWLLTSLMIICFCADWLWRYYDGPSQHRWIGPFIALAFAPSIMVLKSGQIGAWILLGCICFLYFDKKRSYFFAGCAALLISIKPHLCYLLFIAFIFWGIKEHKWSFFFGGITAVLSSMIIILAANPQVLDYYYQATQSYPPTDWASPTIGGTLRWLMSGQMFFLQFLPSTIGFFWFVVYWIKRRYDWNWREQMPLILMVSVLTASYGWPFDYVILIIPIIQAVALALQVKTKKYSLIIIVVLLLATVLALLPRNVFWLFWFCPLMFIWYVRSLALYTESRSLMNQ